MSRMLQQYRDAKALHPGMLVLFRNGDFYELFEEDAELGSKVLGLTLTKRDGTIPMAGVPVHRLEHYLGQLIRGGHRVAVCEQMEEPDPKKKIIHREVNRVVTPGTVTEDTLLDPKAPNHLVAVWCAKAGYGIAWVDLSAGSFAAADVPAGKLADEFSRLNISEVIFPEAQADVVASAAGVVMPRTRSPRPDWTFDPATATQALKTHFAVATLSGFGFADDQPCLTAAGALVIYLQETLRASLAHLRRLQPHRPDALLTLDEVTRRSLELTRTLRDAQREGSLLSVLDRTVTPMGARMLHDSLLAPLTDRAAITARLDAVEEFVRDHALRGQVRDLLDACSDMQRLTARVSTGRAAPPDLAKIAATLRLLPALKAKLAGRRSALLAALEQRLELCPDLRDLLDRAIVPDPPFTAKDGGVIKEGYSPDLDELRKLSSEGKGWIARYQAAEITRTNIASLKVGFNEVHGYYIEITHANASRVPPDYTRKQTLKNAERYITPQLKEYEEKVLSAQEKSQALELQLFSQLRELVAAQTPRLLNAADVLAATDFLAALADLAASRNYVRPVLAAEPVLEIADGRHPVLDVILPPGTFVPNDAAFGPAAGTFWLITGPNMSGKCVRGDTLVFTDRGLLTMDELRPADAAVGEFVPADVGVRGRVGPARATRYYTAGECDTVAIRTRFGFALEGTPEHRVWVRHPDGSEGWRALGEIRPGDRVAVERQLGIWGADTRLARPTTAYHGNTIPYRLPDHLTPDLGYFLGLLVGDGTLTYPNYVCLSSGDAELADEFARIAAEQFGCPVTRKSNGKDFVISSRVIRGFLAANGMGYERADGKRVPPCVRRAPRAVVVAFLQGLFDTDGTAEKRYGNVRLNTASAGLAAEVQMLLLNLGVLAGVRVKQTPALPSHEVGIDGEDAIRFYEVVGFRLARKQARRGLASGIRRPNKGGVPHLETVLKALQHRIAATPGKPTALKRVKNVNSIFYTYLPAGRNPSYAKLGELLDYCDANGIESPELRGVVETGYFYDEVRSVTPSRSAVYDLSVPHGESFVANGFVNHNSTFIRQVAIITLMAHVGSFVPAKAATVGLTDRIFTRVGASDELGRGQSTFMVEMTEAANILNNATPRSLVILDEIGRGTSTYDGVSLAWAITEFLHGAVGCRTLFATHYHELAQLAGTLPNLRNYNVTVREHEDEVVFLHKIVPGNADKSYGIHVARLAGVPEAVLSRAEAVLATLETRHQLPVGSPPPVEAPAKAPRKKPAPRVVQPPEAPKPKAGPPSLFDDPDGPPF